MLLKLELRVEFVNTCFDFPSFHDYSKRVLTSITKIKGSATSNVIRMPTFFRVKSNTLIVLFYSIPLRNTLIMPNRIDINKRE